MPTSSLPCWGFVWLGRVKVLRVHGEFTCVCALLCLENTVSLQSPTGSGSYHLSAFSSWMLPKSSGEGLSYRCPIQCSSQNFFGEGVEHRGDSQLAKVQRLCPKWGNTSNFFLIPSPFSFPFLSLLPPLRLPIPIRHTNKFSLYNLDYPSAHNPLLPTVGLHFGFWVLNHHIKDNPLIAGNFL